MTYKEALSIFRSKYSEECFKRNIPERNYTNSELMFRLSEVQKELGETNRLGKGYFELTGIAEQNVYEADVFPAVSLSKIPIDVFDIEYIIIDGMTNLAPMKKASVEEVEYSRANSLNLYPTLFYINSDNSLVMDGSVTDDMQFNITYWTKYYLFSEDLTTNPTFSDYDESKTGYGGSWKIDSQYHNLIVTGVMAGIFPDLKQLFILKTQQIINATPKFISGKPFYQLGYRKG